MSKIEEIIEIYNAASVTLEREIAIYALILLKFMEENGELPVIVQSQLQDLLDECREIENFFNPKAGKE